MSSNKSVRSSVVVVLILFLTCAETILWSPEAKAETGARTVQYAGDGHCPNSGKDTLLYPHCASDKRGDPRCHDG